MADPVPLVLRSLPGIKRDGTLFDGDIYADGQWVRFQRGLPRKIGGYRSITKYLSEISRGFSTFPFQANAYCHSGSASLLERFTVDAAGNASIMSDRTPAGLTVSSSNLWMFDYIYDSSTTDNSIIAHVAPNAADQANDVGGKIYIGAVTDTAALTSIALPGGANATGGIVALHPYLFYYGSAGIIGWSVSGTPSDLTGTGSGIARAWGQKIVKGMPLRAGAGNAPAGLFIAQDAVIRSSFVGGATVFQFDVIAADTSIMSPNSVIDYDGIIYWAGVDRFLAFNGVVREVPNAFNTNWFFDGLNRAYAQKVYAVKVPRYGEIWWCYPRGSATECTHAVVFNVRENVWYDTELPGAGRSSGSFTNFFAAPVMTGTESTMDGYKVWLHERGTDEIDGSSVNPVLSFFETADLSAVAKGQDASLRITRIEPDFVQSGDMEVYITGRANARAPEVVSSTFTFPADPAEPHEEIVMLKEQRRELRVRFTSNTAGGNYEMGQILAYIGDGDGTVLG